MKNSQDILEQLSAIPLLLSAATETWRLYPHDQQLGIAALALYDTTVDSVNVLIQILLRKDASSKRSCKSSDGNRDKRR